MRKQIHAFRKALSHWGIFEYGMLCLIWIILSVPLYLLGWGVASILSFPLLLIVGYIAAKGLMLILDKPDVSSINSVGYVELIDDSRFGVVKKIGSCEYLIDTKFCGKEISLRVNCANERLYEKSIGNAVVLFDRGLELLDVVSDFACQDLLETINEQLTAQGLQRISCIDFNDSISLESIDIDELGNYCFLFDDGGLLGRHSIAVDGNLESGPNYIDTPG